MSTLISSRAGAGSCSASSTKVNGAVTLRPEIVRDVASRNRANPESSPPHALLILLTERGTRLRATDLPNGADPSRVVRRRAAVCWPKAK